MARLLYIEDDQITAMIVSKFLENQHEITVAPTSANAIELLNSGDYDLILMDMCLGDEIEGGELMRKIRRIPGYDHKKVIAFTATAFEDEKNYLKQGFDGFLSKPINREMLRLKVSVYLADSAYPPLAS